MTDGRAVCLGLRRSLPGPRPNADVVYSTGLFGRTPVGTLFTGKPRVLKLTGDPAYERAAATG